MKFGELPRKNCKRLYILSAGINYCGVDRFPWFMESQGMGKQVFKVGKINPEPGKKS